MSGRNAYAKPGECNCLAVRKAARHITQFYDQMLVPSGLRTTQFSILATLRQSGRMTINSLAAKMVMDRTTLGRNILPLERDNLIAVKEGSHDRRSRELRLTAAGEARLKAAMTRWVEAQGQFEAAVGARRASAMRALLHTVAATGLSPSAALSNRRRGQPE